VNIEDVVAIFFFSIGAFFFLAGTVGLLRFPDVYTRLHALTKADNLGLGFVVAGLALDASSSSVVLELGIIWALVLLSSSTNCQLIAKTALSGGARPWRRRDRS
jgi:multicomponent Na+:H+ antiporter subunit G